MILIIKASRGSYDDYFEYITHVFDFGKQKITEEEIKKRYNEYMISIMLENNIFNLHNNYLIVAPDAEQPIIEGRSKNQRRKLYKKLLKEFLLHNWIKQYYDCTEIEDFKEIIAY
jgi:hypothetical protein